MFNILKCTVTGVNRHCNLCMFLLLFCIGLGSTSVGLMLQPNNTVITDANIEKLKDNVKQTDWVERPSLSEATIVNRGVDIDVVGGKDTPILHRSKRWFGWTTVANHFEKVLLPIIDIGVTAHGQKKVEKSFQEVFDAIGKNYDSINKNCEAIINVENKVDRNFVISSLVIEMINETLSAVEKTRTEMHQGFKEVLESIKNLAIEPVILQLKHFIQYFITEKERINDLPQNEYIAKLQEQNSILLYLKDSKTPNGDSIHTLLHDIIEKGYAVPHNVTDQTAFSALYTLYYGTQTYASVMFFLLEHYSYLADYYYRNSDLELYNKYFDFIQTTFRDFKHSLVGTGDDRSLIVNVINILNTVKNKDFMKETGENSLNFLAERITSLTEIKEQIERMELPVVGDMPKKLTGKPKFKEQEINTPIGEWKDGAKVSYTLQFKNNNTYSKVGEWSDPIIVNGKANPFLRIPIDSKRRTRLIFRKINNDRPQLVGVLENNYQTEFRDISRDLYNAASRFDEDIAIKEVEVLMQNGADVNAVFDKGRRSLHAAAQSDNARLAQQYFINNITDINMKDNNGYTPIHIAAEAGHERFIELLMQYSVDVNAKTDFEQLTPLHIAVCKGYALTVETLMENNSTDLNAREKEGFTPLHSAVIGGVPVVLVLMSTDRIDVNAQSIEGLTPLHLLSINNYLDITKILVYSDKTDIAAKAKGNLTALHFASMFGNLETVKLLSTLDGFDVNVESVNSWTPLHFAIALKKGNVASELLKSNYTNVNAKAEGNLTPLHIAAITGHKSVLLGLIEKEATIDEKTENGFAALHLAAVNGNQEAISILTDYGANIDVKTPNGSTPLHLATSSQNCNLDTVKYLISKRADLNAVLNSNETFLHLAARSGCLDIVDYFMEINYNINAQDNSGNSPLHVAVESGHLDIVLYFIDKGANTSIKRYDGKTLLHIAVFSSNLTMVKHFIEKGLDVNAKDNENCTPLFDAAKRDYFSIVHYLVNEKNADVNAKSRDGKTVLHLAALSGKTAIVMFLIDKGAYINAKDINGVGPLLYAAGKGNLDIVKYFIKEKNVDVSVICNFASRSIAAFYGHFDVFKYLLYKERDTTLTIINSYVSLLSAAQNGHLDIVKAITEVHFEVQPKVEQLLIYASKILRNKITFNEKGFSNIFEIYYAVFSKIINSTLSEHSMYFFSILLSAENGHLDVVKYFLDEKHFDVNAHTDDGSTFLHHFAAYGNLDMVRYLIDEKQADFNKEDDNGMTPLLFAVKSNHLDIVRYLVGKGAYLNSSKNRAPLLFAAAKNNLDMVKYLMERGADINARNTGGWVTELGLKTSLIFLENKDIVNKSYYDSIPLSNAARNGHLGMVRYLIEKGADVNAKNTDGSTPLHSAAKNGHLDITKYLVDEHYANINIKDTQYQSPFYYAAKNCYLDIAKYLVDEKHANVKVMEYSNLLEFAVKQVNLEMVRYLIEKGASMSRNVLLYAAESGSLEIAKYLIEKGASVHFKSRDFFSYDMTPLHYAAKNGHLDIVKYLVNEKRADINVKDKYYWTPLHYAADKGYLDIYKYLRDEKGANNVPRDLDKKTPFVCALNNFHSSIVMHILKTGSPGYSCEDANKCLPGAIKCGLLDLVKFLVEKGADVNLKHSSGFLSPHQTPLQIAMINGHFDIAKYLIEKKADINAKNSRGLFTLSELTSLHFAAENGPLSMVKYLVDKGADINAKAEAGMNVTITPLNMANIYCNSDIADFLQSKVKK